MIRVQEELNGEKFPIYQKPVELAINYAVDEDGGILTK